MINLSENDRQKLSDFLNQHTLMVVSTVGETGAPQSAAVEFSHDAALDIFFDTFKDARKYHNLIDDPRVSLVIGGADGRTLQAEGEALELAGARKEAACAAHREKLRDAEKFENNPDITYFAIRLNWARLTDVTTQPWTIHIFT